MKAFYVMYNVAGVEGLEENILVTDEINLETALESKSKEGFKFGDGYSKIVFKEEIPLSKVKIGELSITEFILLNKFFI